MDRLVLDVDTGANGLQNNPVLMTAVHVANTTVVTGSFNSIPNRVFKIELYLNPTNIAGQGKQYLNTYNVNTNAAGNVAPLSMTVNLFLPTGQYVTATAIDMITGDTSEFSNAIIVS
jgi:hypothetical protein